MKEPEDRIEALVGVGCHPSRHIVRAISSEIIYLVHPDDCVARGLTHRRSLTQCRFGQSLALYGIDERLWAEHMDVPVFVLRLRGHLVPAGPAGGEE